jgi:hypothetical protein
MPRIESSLMPPATFDGDGAFLVWADRKGVKVCNCAGCSRVVSSDPFVRDGSRKLAGRLKGRPYCRPCFNGG